MTTKRTHPTRDDNSILEATSERHFRNLLPIGWLVDKPADYGIDLIVTPVLNNDVKGFNFSVQLKGQNECKSVPTVSLKKIMK